MLYPVSQSPSRLEGKSGGSGRSSYVRLRLGKHRADRGILEGLQASEPSGVPVVISCSSPCLVLHYSGRRVGWRPGQSAFVWSRVSPSVVFPLSWHPLRMLLHQETHYTATP